MMVGSCVVEGAPLVPSPAGWFDLLFGVPWVVLLSLVVGGCRAFDFVVPLLPADVADDVPDVTC